MLEDKIKVFLYMQCLKNFASYGIPFLMNQLGIFSPKQRNKLREK